MKNLSQKNRLLLAFVIGGVGILIGVSLGNYFVKGRGPSPTPEVTTAPSKSRATLSFYPEETEVDVGDEFSVEVRLNAEGLVLSGLAVRMVYEYEGDLPLEPQDVKMRVNPALAGMDWVFPVNTIEVDERNKRVVAELAAVNLNPGGYPAEGSVTFATIDFNAESSSSNDLAFTFDAENTKLLTKDGREVEIELVERLYSVD